MAYDNGSWLGKPSRLLIVEGIGFFVRVDEDQVEGLGLQLRKCLSGRDHDHLNLGGYASEFKVCFGNLGALL